MWLGAPFAFLAIVLVLGFYIRFIHYVAPEVLKRWANEQGYQILHQREAGPFKRLGIGTSNNQVVYEVTVVDRTGATLSGFIKIGSCWWPNYFEDICPVEAFLDQSKKVDPSPEL